VALIGDRYRLVKPIATGGMGTVWEGWDERLQRRVAIKQLHPPQPGLDPQAARVAAERVLREARNAARLHHPHAVPVYDVVEDDGRPCLIMQYLPAQSLQQVLAARGPLDVPTVARIGSEVASALEAAHQVGIVHRDVKPGNVLIDGEGTAKLTDFGISHAAGDPSLTSTGLVTGTPAYLAPEVARGGPATPASDVFSLGAMLFTALEGISPFGDGQNAMATLHRAASGAMEPPRRSGALTQLLQRMLSVDPAQRPAMAEVARVLRTPAGGPDPLAFARTQQLAPPPPPPPSSTVVLPPVGPPRPPVGPPLGPPVGPPRPPQPAPRRRRAWPIVVGFLIAGALLGGLVALLINGLKDGGSPSTTTPPARTQHVSAPKRSASKSHSTSHSPSPPSTPSTPPPSTPNTSGAASTPAATTDPAAAVTSYYALLPDNTDAAWNRLTKRFQEKGAKGRDTYDAYWASVDSVSVSNAVSTGPKDAEATIHYVYDDGRRVSERTAFHFKDVGGELKIDRTDTVG